MKKQKSSTEYSKHKDTKITSPFFTPEILGNIFLWLPLASLYSASLVCKEWLATISDPYFLRTHHIHQGYALLFQEPSSRFYQSYIVRMQGGLLSNIETTCLHVTKKIISSCKEFALIKPKEDRPYLSVFNIATQKTLWLPHSPLTVSAFYANYYGIGFNPTTERFKVVCFGRKGRDNFVWCEVLNQGSLTWREIEIPCNGYIVPGRSISINGFLHWHGKTFTSNCTKIISLDLNSEKFLETPVPIICNLQGSSTFELLEIEGCLSLMESNDSCQIQFKIWCLKDISHGTWEIRFSISLDTIKCDPFLTNLDDLYYIGGLYNGKFLVFKHHMKRATKFYYVVDVVKQEIMPEPLKIRI